VTTFDERAAAFFQTNPARAADMAEDEAKRRYRAGLDRAALLVANMTLALRQQASPEDSPKIQDLQQMKASLLARLGNHASTESVMS
jgi:hypothetical protein